VGPDGGGASVMDVPGILAPKDDDVIVGAMVSGFGDKNDVVGIIAGIRVVVVNGPVVVWSAVVWSPVVV